MTKEEIKIFVEERIRINQTAIMMHFGQRGPTLYFKARREEAQKILDFINEKDDTQS